RLGEAEHVVVLTLHHLICDGWSLGVLWRELWGELPHLPIQYGDFAAWERRSEWDLSFWKAKLAGCPPLLPLPADHPRPPLQSFRGEVRTRPLAMTRPDFATLLATFLVLLQRYTGRDDL